MIERKIERKIIYYGSCDSCKKRILFGFNIKQDLINFIIKRGWRRKGRKWLCPDCQKSGDSLNSKTANIPI